MRAQSDRCVHCRRKFSETVTPTFDHVVPRSFGGKVSGNVVMCCKRCNDLRGNIPLSDFLNGYVCYGYKDRHDEWRSEMRKVRGKRRWYHGDLIKW